MSELVRRVKLAGDSYADQGLRQEHDVVQFFCDALTKMAEGEVKAGRVAAGGAVSGEAEARVTHVERMFGFLVEERWSCDGCFAVGKSSRWSRGSQGKINWLQICVWRDVCHGKARGLVGAGIARRRHACSSRVWRVCQMSCL